MLAGKNKGTWIDSFSSVLALVGISLPGFVIGPLLVYLFGGRYFVRGLTQGAIK